MTGFDIYNWAVL